MFARSAHISLTLAEYMQATAKKGGDFMATRKIGRDAGTGQFITVKEARNRPKGAVVETLRTVEKVYRSKM